MFSISGLKRNALPDINLPINLNIERAEVGENSQWAGSFIVSFEHNYCAVPKRERETRFFLPITPTSADLGKSTQTPLYITKET